MIANAKQRSKMLFESGCKETNDLLAQLEMDADCDGYEGGESSIFCI